MAAVVALAGQAYGLYRPVGPPTPAWFPQADKLAHAVGFGAPLLLMLLTRQAFTGAVSRRFGLVVILACVGHAVLSEVIQHFYYRFRTGDPFDVLADWVGVALGVGVFGATKGWARNRPGERR